MLTLQYWLEHYSGNLEVRRYFPAEFMAQNPARFDERTLVVLGSNPAPPPRRSKLPNSSISVAAARLQ